MEGTVGYFIAGSAFILLSMIWAFVKKRAKRNKKYEEAENDVKKGVSEHNFGAILDGIRRMRNAK